MNVNFYKKNSAKGLYASFNFSVIINPCYGVKKINQASYNFIAGRGLRDGLVFFLTKKLKCKVVS